MHPQLSQYFVGAAGKRLSAVESSRTASNQHEFNGVKRLAALLGEPTEKQYLPTRFLYIDDELATLDVPGAVTWYDARRRGREERGVQRWEYRMYYPTNPVMEAARAGDYLVLAKRPDGSLVAIVSPESSSVAAQLRSVFGLDYHGEVFAVLAEPRQHELSLAATTLLEALGVEVDWTDETRLDALLVEFGPSFPSTRVFSAYARQETLGVNAAADPDGAIQDWMTMEELLFRTLEKHLVTAQLRSVEGDVDGVLSVAQRAFQRRRARAGQALENHIEEVLRVHRLPYAREGVTENAKRPDFLLPGVEAYLDLDYPADKLMMLGAKTTCRDRWRQVLTEADRIPAKHLVTLEAPISSNQLDEMSGAQLTLVIPQGLHAAFAPSDRHRLLSVRGALDLAEQTLRGAGPST